MNNKLLLTLVFATAFVLGTFAQKNYELKMCEVTKSVAHKAPQNVKSNEYIIKNCGDEIKSVVGGIKSKVTFRIMNKVSKGNAQLLSGNKLTKISYCLGSETGTDNTGISNLKVFVTEEPDGDYITSQISEETTKGLHEIILDTPYEISDKEFYIGYEADLDANCFGIGASEGNYELTYLYFYDSINKTWEYSGWSKDFGIALIYATAEGDNVPDKSSLAVKYISSPIYTKSGEEASFTFTVTNTGFDTIPDINVTYNFDENETKTANLDLKPSESKTLTLRHTFDLQSGFQSKQINIKVVPTGKEDIDLSDNEFDVFANIYADDFTFDGQKKVLLEQFTTEKCSYCPNGDKNINNALAKYTKGEVIRMAHHSGFYQDKLTLNYTEAMLYFYNDASYAPACMIDRKYREYSDTPGPVFGISVPMIQKAIDEDLSNPLFATVNLDTEYNKDTRTLDIKVNGKCLLNLKNLRLNIIMTEDGINGYQAGAGGTWTHYHATRDALTDNTGVSITLDDDGNYSYQTTYKIPTSISGVLNQSVAVNSEKINIIAFLCEMPLDNPLACEVLNAEIAEKPASTTSIKDINGENFSIYVENGYLVVDGEFDNAQLFDINGSLVKNINEKVSSVSDLNNGIYLVKVFANGNSSVSKVLINR